jgi:hypothetical protein
MGDAEGEKKLYEEAREAVVKAHGEGHRMARELAARLSVKSMTNVE